MQAVTTASPAAAQRPLVAPGAAAPAPAPKAAAGDRLELTRGFAHLDPNAKEGWATRMGDRLEGPTMVIGYTAMLAVPVAGLVAVGAGLFGAGRVALGALGVAGAFLGGTFGLAGLANWLYKLDK